MVEQTPQEPAQPKPPSPAAARPRPSTPPAPTGPTLDERGVALLKLLEELAPSAPMELSSALDEVVGMTTPERLLDTALLLRDDPRLAFDYLRCLSVVDYGESLQVVYHLWSMEHRHKVALKTDTPMDDPRVPSLVSVWAGVDWFEREGRDLYGVTFEGHPDLKPLLLWEGFEGFPGRRSFPLPEYKEY